MASCYTNPKGNSLEVIKCIYELYISNILKINKLANNKLNLNLILSHSYSFSEYKMSLQALNRNVSDTFQHINSYINHSTFRMTREYMKHQNNFLNTFTLTIIYLKYKSKKEILYKHRYNNVNKEFLKQNFQSKE